jgi:serine/threonine-protein kinase
MLAHHVSTPPVPPSRRSELEVPEAFDRVILACLEKDPARRPASADALAELLAAVGPVPAWGPERARAWWDAHLPGRPEGARTGQVMTQGAGV